MRMPAVRSIVGEEVSNSDGLTKAFNVWSLSCQALTQKCNGITTYCRSNVCVVVLFHLNYLKHPYLKKRKAERMCLHAGPTALRCAKCQMFLSSGACRQEGFDQPILSTQQALKESLKV